MNNVFHLRLKSIMTFLVILCICTCYGKGKGLKFAIVSDLHAPDVPAGKEIVQTFIDAAKREKVDFIIELGDFCRLDEKSKIYRDIWNSFEGNKYHVIGNHDMDRYTPEQYMAGMGMPNRYYSFDKGNFHFIVLDGNNIYDNGKYIHYSEGNYYKSKNKSYMDPEQMEWLKEDLRSTDKKCILFTHESIEREMGNREEVRKILEDENRRAGFKKVVLSFSGHNHSNYTDVINGITYMQINSASYVWIGKPTRTEKRYPAEINKQFSLMKYSITYTKPLYAIVTLTDKEATVKGTEADFVSPTPQELGMGDYIGIFPLVSYIKDAKIRFNK